MTDNTSNNKRIAKNTVFLYFRSMLLLLINLYTSRVTLKVLGVEDYGIYQVVGGVVAMFSMLSSTLASASQRFITYALGENDKENVKKVFSTCITLHIGLAGIVVLLLEIIGIWFLNTKLNIPVDRLSIAGWVMQFSIATLFVSIISVPFNALITAHEKMSVFAYISILEGLLKLGAVFLLIVIGWDKLLIYAALQFTIALLLRIIYSSYCSTHFEEARRLKLNIEKQLYKEMFAFSSWNLIGSSALVLRNQGIDILLNLFFGVTVNAAKGISNQIQSAVTQLIGNFTTAVSPQLVQSIAKEDYARTHNLIFKGGKMAFMLIMIIAVPFILCCEDILNIWLVEVPNYSILMVQITFLYLLTNTLSKFLVSSVLAYGDIKWFQIIVGGVKMLAIPLTWLLVVVTNSPYSGVVVVTFLQFACLSGELYFANKFVHIDWGRYLINVVARCWITFAITFIPLYLLVLQFELPFLIKASVTSVESIVLIYLIGLDKSEKQLVSQIIHKVLHK